MKRSSILRMSREIADVNYSRSGGSVYVVTRTVVTNLTHCCCAICFILNPRTRSAPRSSCIVAEVSSKALGLLFKLWNDVKLPFSG